LGTNGANSSTLNSTLQTNIGTAAAFSRDNFLKSVFSQTPQGQGNAPMNLDPSVEEQAYLDRQAVSGIGFAEVLSQTDTKLEAEREMMDQKEVTYAQMGATDATYQNDTLDQWAQNNRLNTMSLQEKEQEASYDTDEANAKLTLQKMRVEALREENIKRAIESNDGGH